MFRMKIGSGLVFALFVLLSACASEPVATQPVSENGQELENTHWQLVSFDSTDSETPVVDGTELTLNFDSDGQATGSAGCNSYGGVYRVEQGQLTIAEVVSTLMACTDTAIMDQEVHYLTALQTTGEFELSEERLIIHFGDGLSTLNFVKISE
jgi:heat shock protein HslJ